MDQLYVPLRRRASDYLRRERMDHTLQPTALVHETYLRLVRQTRVDWQGHNHLMAVASDLMRRILIDHARKRSRQRRGGDQQRVDWSTVSDWLAAEPQDMVVLDGALDELREWNPELARVVTMRFFGGFRMAEIGAALGVSVGTVARRWALARAWLYQRLEDPRSVTVADLGADVSSGSVAGRLGHLSRASSRIAGELGGSGAAREKRDPGEGVDPSTGTGSAGGSVSPF